MLRNPMDLLSDEVSSGLYNFYVTKHSGRITTSYLVSKTVAYEARYCNTAGFCTFCLTMENGGRGNMNHKTYLLLFDILGFAKMADEIASKNRMESRIVRAHFLEILKDKVNALEAKGQVAGKHYGESDDWLLALDSPDKVFQVISGILEHHTGYLDYQTIPLELAVGIAEFDTWASFSKGKLIVEDATIEFLKKHFFYRYHDWHKKHNKGQSIRSTYIITTESAQSEMANVGPENLDPIDHEGVRFFVADADRFQQRGRVFGFLNKIGHPGSRWYEGIDNLYVPPLEYPEIKRTLSVSAHAP
ncbi:MAG: hypothetical protein HY730_09305 [Candidatus Tectomicrobia bacterium]|uniref:Uncharacterized protein n=1 Tax=Tectimicrobiota bacterium TaxID=2528274 RepID=A0A933LRP5_UNCTE|nr:hypothetical protein [Candidatus Tectomicrobia bacterium]